MSDVAPDQAGGTDSDDNVVPPEQPVPQEPEDGEPVEQPESE